MKFGSGRPDLQSTFPYRRDDRDGPGPAGGAHVAPFIEQAAMEASATARRDDAKILHSLTRELVREINPSTKIIIFAIIIFAVVGPFTPASLKFNEARRNRRVIAEQQAQLAAQH
jgi:hypothetical protein